VSDKEKRLEHRHTEGGHREMTIYKTRREIWNRFFLPSEPSEGAIIVNI
jgi:hypothetical protein